MFDPGNFDYKKLVERYETMLNQGDEFFFDVEDFQQICDHYLHNGKVESALKALNYAIGQHAFSSDLLVRRAQVFLDLHRLIEALIDIDKAENMDPENADLFLTKAEWHSKKGQHTKAVQNLKKAGELLGSMEEVNILLAQEYLELADYQKAAHHFKAVLLDDFDDGSALFSLSFCYDMLGKNEELIDFLKQYIEENPYSEIAWHQLGLVHQKNKDYEKAIEAFDYACVIDDLFSAAHYEKARAYELLGQHQKAIDIYIDLLELEDLNAYTYLRIGLAYREMGDDKQAMRYYQKGYQEDPDMEDVLLNMVNLCEENESWREAVFYAKKLTTVSDSQGFKFYSAIIHHKAGLIDEAIEMLANLMQQEDAPPEVYLMYSELMFEMEYYTDGLDILYLAMEYFPENPEIQLRLGAILYQMQEYDESLIYFKKALKLNRNMVDDFMIKFPAIKDDPIIQNLLS
ncbi:MAG: tetratricopeptide repeat protein [Cryomorphaceae bacterium]|nr:tetratricopeptide repeat protein [Cryomorphaceae bacterium]